MKIETFIQEVKKYDCDVKTNGSIITLHKVTKYWVTKDMFSPREEKTRLEVPFLTMNEFEPQFVTDEQWQNVYGLNVEKLRTVLTLVKKVKDTPVSERFAEKMWRLRWIHPSGFLDYGYLKVNGECWKMVNDSDDATIFTSTELKELKKNYPTYAPAIDAIKEPAIAKDAGRTKDHE